MKWPAPHTQLGSYQTVFHLIVYNSVLSQYCMTIDPIEVLNGGFPSMLDFPPPPQLSAGSVLTHRLKS